MKIAIMFATAMILVVLLIIAKLYPASPLLWLASMSTMIMGIRYALVFVLLWFLIYVPKTTWLRMPIGLMTLILSIWVADVGYEGTLGIIDFVTLFPATIAVLIALLDSKPKDQPFRLAEYTAVVPEWAFEKVRVPFSWSVQFAWLFLSDFGLALMSRVELALLTSRLIRQRQHMRSPRYPHRLGRTGLMAATD